MMSIKRCVSIGVVVATLCAGPVLADGHATDVAPVGPTAVVKTKQATGFLAWLFGMGSIPASNPDPAVVANQVIRPPAGYRLIWTDGRINPHRGLPEAADTSN